MCLYYYSYKDTSVEVAETARALAGAYSNVATEDAESESLLIFLSGRSGFREYILFS